MQVNKQITNTQNNKHTPDKLVIIHNKLNTLNISLSYKKCPHTQHLRENICRL